MSEEAYSYMKSMAKMHLEHGGKYHKGLVMGYLFALIDLDVVTFESFYDWCDYMDGKGDCPTN